VILETTQISYIAPSSDIQPTDHKGVIAVSRFVVV